MIMLSLGRPDGRGFSTLVRAPSAQYSCSPRAPFMAFPSKKQDVDFLFRCYCSCSPRSRSPPCSCSCPLLHVGFMPLPPALAIPPPMEEKQHQQQAPEVACPRLPFYSTPRGASLRGLRLPCSQERRSRLSGMRLAARPLASPTPLCGILLSDPASSST